MEERVAAVTSPASVAKKIDGEFVCALVCELRELVIADEPRVEPLRLEKTGVVHILYPHGHPLQYLKMSNFVDQPAFDIVQCCSHAVFPDVTENIWYSHGSPGSKILSVSRPEPTKPEGYDLNF